jgi:riboflavin kinase/FMN adenylyltransferase
MIQVFRGLNQVPASFGPSIVSVGNFDGVHQGHQEILHTVIREARTRNARAVAITFDPHPDSVLRPDKAPQILTPMNQRVRLVLETGIDAVVILPFNLELAKLSAREFLERVLVRTLGAIGVHEGENFRFGHKAEAGVKELASFGEEYGFTVTVHKPVCVHGLEVSSSAVRALVSEGDMRRARWMLGRPFGIRSTPKRDRGIGTKLLVPTVNLAPYAGQLPAFGVYVTQLTIGNRTFQAVSNVGVRPTFEGAGFSVESHILNFDPVELDDSTPLYLEFLFHLRDEQKFATPDDLRAQIMKDVSRAQRYFRRAGP